MVSQTELYSAIMVLMFDTSTQQWQVTDNLIKLFIQEQSYTKRSQFFFKLPNNDKDLFHFLIKTGHSIYESVTQHNIIDVSTLVSIEVLALYKALSLGKLDLAEFLLERFTFERKTLFWICAAKRFESMRFLFKKNFPLDNYTIGEIAINGGIQSLRFIIEQLNVKYSCIDLRIALDMVKAENEKLCVLYLVKLLKNKTK